MSDDVERAVRDLLDQYAVKLQGGTFDFLHEDVVQKVVALATELVEKERHAKPSFRFTSPVITTTPRSRARTILADVEGTEEVRGILRDLRLEGYEGPISHIYVQATGISFPYSVRVSVRTLVKPRWASGDPPAPDPIEVAFNFGAGPAIDAHHLLVIVRKTIHLAVVHELDENLMVGDRRPFDPHRGDQSR